MSSNGFLTFQDAGGTASLNQSIPTETGPNAFVAPYWDDLTGRRGQVFYATLGTQPSRRFVVQWHRFRRVGFSGTRLTFEAILHEGSNQISFHYGPMTYGDTDDFQGGSATVGIENHEGTAGEQLSFDAPNIRQGASAYFLPPLRDDTSSYLAVGLSEGFEDISHIGTALPALHEEINGFEEHPIGFDFPFDGGTFDRVVIATNGLLQFGEPNGPGNPVNQLIPTLLAPSGIMAPLWTNLEPRTDGTRGTVYAHQVGIEPRRRFIVQWQSMPHAQDADMSATFQVILDEETGTASYHYGGLHSLSFDPASVATVGVESLDGTRGSLHSFNQAGAVRSGGHVRLFLVPR